jgi:UDP-N-acetylglucosamine diphosphorylase/glucosamine-1-phosphate N-acetyltransferase|tara:strand:- start:137 stop:1312 length:1176 start_codon:yes stop_codon:yes gene_type:complete
MNYILFDGSVRNALLPFTYTRPVADIRVGILTIREKWERRIGVTTTTLTEEYLEEKFPMVEMEQNIMINASFLPTDQLVEELKELKENQALIYKEDIVAFFTTDTQEVDSFDDFEQLEFDSELLQIKNTWDIFSLNSKAIQQDFDFITEGRKSAGIPEMTVAFNKENIFIEDGAKLPLCSLNAIDGPIYIGENAEIMEGSSVRGPFALCDNSTLKMGTKIYGGTTIGPHSKVGGEVNNSVIFGYSNKGHDGFLGNAVIGEWCNLGAGTNNSNLKNNYAEVKLWSYETGRFAKTGLQFCGLMMGDHSKCGINTMFNTGTVLGVSANIFGPGFPRNFIPSFSWGGSGGFTTYQMNKVKEVATVVMLRRGLDFDEKEVKILEHIFEETKQYRNF